MVPRAVLMKNGLRTLNTARPVNTAHPKTTVYSARPMPNTAVVNVVWANQVNAVKASTCWVWRPTKLNRSSTTRRSSLGCQFLGCRLISWQCKKQIVVATSSTEAKYVAAASYCRQNKVLVVKPHNKTPYELFRGDGPKWLFDIDVLTKSMTYVPVVADTNSNDFVGTQESTGACQSNKEIGSSQDYILMPLWKNGFNNLIILRKRKKCNTDEPQPSNDVGKKDDEGEIDKQERPKKSAQDVNLAGPSINTTGTNDNTGSLNINTVPSTPNTRIHKDHSLDNVIGDVKSSEEPKRIAKALSDSAWVEAMQEELLQFLTQKMSSMGELTFFLGLQVKQKADGIFISHDKYVADILRKFSFIDVRTASTPMDTEKPLLKDSDDKQSSMIGIGDTSSGVQFWQTATVSTLENGDMEITATIDGKVKVISEASIRRHLKLEDSNGISDLPTIEIFEQLALIGDFIKQETEVPRPSSPTQTHVADEAASTGVDVRHRGAATTISSFDAGQGSGNINKTLSMPHDSPLLRVHTLGSDEGRMQHNKLIDLVTKLSDRVVSLETDQQQTKKVYGDAYTRLIKKFKRLEDKLNKSRRKRILVLSEEEDSDTKILAQEDPSKQGRKIA
ncbi:putative ribonuclease H-like domain-containing protein [Tanacetum coccineum]|uniref:Ribonuclease H-like domain-containing protein n=1 Tax=Tanacetum coccineum TaxID=301880 RepID=A0ABQ5F1V9_9ASTR